MAFMLPCSRCLSQGRKTAGLRNTNKGEMGFVKQAFPAHFKGVVVCMSFIFLLPLLNQLLNQDRECLSLQAT